MKRLLILTAILTLMVGAANSQVLKPVKWQISFKKVSEGVYDIICKATVESGWHLYDTKLPENGPLPTTFNIDEDETKDIELVGEFKATTNSMSFVSSSSKLNVVGRGPFSGNLVSYRCHPLSIVALQIMS